MKTYYYYYCTSTIHARTDGVLLPSVDEAGEGRAIDLHRGKPTRREINNTYTHRIYTVSYLNQVCGDQQHIHTQHIYNIIPESSMWEICDSERNEMNTEYNIHLVKDMR